MPLEASGTNHAAYEEAVSKLKLLQTYRAALLNEGMQRSRLLNMAKFTSTLGLEDCHLDDLHVIHITGTKGKGSTCAFAESILRHRGYKTGFFSSPPLLEHRDQIKLNGDIIDRDLFVHYFNIVYKALDSDLVDESRNLNHFTFLTCMAFYIFVAEKVDVAIIEVGLGGAFDATNFIKHPMVCGIVSIGHDHEIFLGYTIESIAKHKAGILKPGVVGVTVPQKYPEALQVLQHEAEIIGAPFKVVSPDSLILPAGVKLGLQGKFQEENACLAVTLCNLWESAVLKKNGSLLQPPLTEKEITAGLENVVWPGRCQVLKRNNVTLYTDCAHTVESLEACSLWFVESSEREASSFSSETNVLRILLCCFTKERDDKKLLNVIISVTNFDIGIFPTTFVYKSKSTHYLDMSKPNCEADFKRCQLLQETWQEINEDHSSTAVFSVEEALQLVFSLAKGQSLEESKSQLNLASSSDSNLLGLTKLVNNDQVNSANSQTVPKNIHLQVLITGSSYLVGGCLNLLNSQFN